MRKQLAIALLVVIFFLGCIFCIEPKDNNNNNVKVNFTGHQVLRFTITTDEDRATLAKLIREWRLDLWAENPEWVDVRVSPDVLMSTNNLNSSRLSFNVMITDLQQLIDAETRSIKAAANEPFFAAYRTLDEFNNFLDDLRTGFPDLVQKKFIGTTVENRPINGITISSKKKSAAEKIGIVYNGGQHAREWISPMTNAWIANELVSRYGKDTLITNLVDEIEWTIIPVVNADGYVYSWTTNRMWRKNRRYNANSWFGCYGVDTNRNWDFHWNEGGSSSDTCADDYMGPSAFSEPEETALAEYIKKQGNVKGYIDFHAYSQLWMTPWGYTSKLPEDYNVQLAGAKACVEALTAVYGTAYKYGSISRTIYPASGSSVDYVYGVTNVTMSFAVELRDTGKYGFVLPVSEIVPTGKETMAAVEAMASFILANADRL